MTNVVETRPLDEAVWQAWVLRGIADDKRSRATQIQGLQWISVLALFAAGLFDAFR